MNFEIMYGILFIPATLGAINTFIGWKRCIECSASDGLLYHESTSLLETKVCDYHQHIGQEVLGVCCENFDKDYSGEISLSCKSTSDGGIDHNYCGLGSITELGPIWYSHCSDIRSYAEDGSDRTICSPNSLVPSTNA